MEPVLVKEVVEFLGNRYQKIMEKHGLSPIEMADLCNVHVAKRCDPEMCHFCEVDRASQTHFYFRMIGLKVQGEPE